MAASSVPIILLLLLSVSVETRPSPYKDDRQVLIILPASLLYTIESLPGSSRLVVPGHVTCLFNCSFLQVSRSLFGSRLTSLMEVTPTPDDITEGSASPPTSRSHSKGLILSHQGNGSGLARRQEVLHQFFLDFLRQQVKTRRWSRKSMVGGRGCFGMKLDRIGSISGLGC